LNELREKNSILEQKMDMLTIECNSISTQKITELSKTNRHLNARLSSQNTRCRELESKIHQLEKMLFEQECQIKENKQLQRECEPSELQQLNDELERTKRKLFESSNQNHQLKNELKMAHKCLQQEIGIEANISQILQGNTNWRGRAQQIAMLQSKINELKEKFDSDFESFETNRIPLKRLESVRRMEIESLNKELEDCKNELDDVKQKLVALKTRNKNLGDDLNNYKLKTLELMEKSKNDDDYIQSLNEKISMTKFECEHKINEIEKEILEAEKRKDQSDLEVQKLHCHIENLNAAVAQKENQIACLKSEKEQLESNLRNVSGDFLFSCRDMSKESYVDIMNTLEQEKKQLLVMMTDLNERCNKASVKENEQHEMITKQKTKIARLEAKIKEFESEKEAMKNKHRRAIRISEYSRSMSGSSISRPVTKAKHERSVAVDSLKIK
jgi:chromosome segregation ATPase